ncbi:MAG: PAS domain S-box protein [Elusimicrobia bacterium]|nr:PAS domain S-box protein [Elusimicrobiota bacterium]
MSGVFRKKTADASGAESSALADVVSALGNSAIVAVTDAKGRISYVNDMFCAISKYSREELLGQDHRIIKSGRHPREFFRDMWRTISGGNVWHGDICNKAKDGSLYWVDTTITPFLDKAGKSHKYIAIRHDITARHNLAMFKEETLALANHELRNPLTTVYAAVVALLSGEAGPLSDDAVEFLTIAKKSCRRMIELVEKFLTLDALEAGKLEFRRERVDLGELLQEAVEAAGLACGGEPNRVTLAPTSLVVVADRNRLMEVVVNVISNALKFSPPDAPVEVSAERFGDQARVRVRDRGPGIPKEFRRRIFQRFARAHGVTERGSGLGLNISKAIIEGLGGSIGFETTPGEGSTFFFELPREGADSQRN